MGYLIILRGPPGSGKTTISESLKERTCLLNLDEIATFESNLKVALKTDYQHTIGEINHGNSHTEEPEAWISNIKEKGCTILSVILHSSFDYCFKNAKSRPTNPLNEKEMRYEYDKFYHKLLTIFAYKAKVKEICVACEHKDTEEIAKEIKEYLEKL